VLYEATDSANVNFSASNNALTFDSAKAGAVNTSFDWSGGNGPYTVHKTAGNVMLCGSAGKSCSVVKTLAPVGTPVYVKDDDDATASTTVTN